MASADCPASSTRSIIYQSTVASKEHYTGHQLCLTQVTLSIDPELVVRLCASERQEIPLDLAEPDAVDRIRTPIATTAHAHNQSTTA